MKRWAVKEVGLVYEMNKRTTHGLNSIGVTMDSEAAISTSEQTAAPNAGSARGYEVIDATKAELEKICPEVVSCVDILAVSARDTSFAVGGPSWTVKFGRKDSTTASRDLANSDLPFFGSNVNQLIANFARKGLSARDVVALSGAHTIGQAQCSTFSDRINSNGSDIDAGFASTRTRVVAGMQI
ncbi:hypothetical protein RHSIM_Rhsim05G0141000 [Rhododendron simsii]|uniref:peroxidase n=1 Tax=Rhododendron simsii TaxID=118357 RepID=A0A834H140_RHOSS|nr:hypothetical protein RHSIM_Rhsim05G0141000 [Rhododendron simsii]